MRFRSALAVLAIALAAAALAAQSRLETDVARADDQYLAAMRQVDRVALQQLLADDFTATNHTGATSNKQEVLSRSPNNHPLPRDRRIRVYGAQTAVVTSILDNPDVGPVRQLRVWVKNGDKWQLVVGQGTRIATPSSSQ